jgi:predicted transcriptional regulator
MALMGKRLDKLEKVVEILTVLKMPKLKSQVMQACNLSTSGATFYLEWLVRCGLLDVDKRVGEAFKVNRMVYRTSSKGLDFLKKYGELLSFMNVCSKNEKYILVAK